MTFPWLFFALELTTGFDSGVKLKELTEVMADMERVLCVNAPLKTQLKATPKMHDKY